jgi:hypothetical protein
LGIRFWTVTASSAATAAENKPVCSFPCCYVQGKIDADTAETHENEEPFGIFLPAIGHLVVLILCGLGVHGEERP